MKIQSQGMEFHTNVLIVLNLFFNVISGIDILMKINALINYLKNTRMWLNNNTAHEIKLGCREENVYSRTNEDYTLGELATNLYQNDDKQPIINKLCDEAISAKQNQSINSLVTQYNSVFNNNYGVIQCI